MISDPAIALGASHPVFISTAHLSLVVDLALDSGHILNFTTEATPPGATYA